MFWLLFCNYWIIILPAFTASKIWTWLHMLICWFISTLKICLCIHSIPRHCRAGFLPRNPGTNLHVSLYWQQHNKHQQTTFHYTCYVIQPAQFTKQDTNTVPDMYTFPNSWWITFHCAQFSSAFFQNYFCIYIDHLLLQPPVLQFLPYCMISEDKNFSFT